MSMSNQQQNEAFSIATLLYARLRRVTLRVVDVIYLLENKEYAKYVLDLSAQTNDPELLKYVARLTGLLNLEVIELESVENSVMEPELTTEKEHSTEAEHRAETEPTEEEIYRAQVSHHYIGALR